MTPTDKLLQQHTTNFPYIKPTSFCLAYCLNYPEDGGSKLLWNHAFKSTQIHIAQDWDLHEHQYVNFKYRIFINMVAQV